jgi:hypothetical protein
MLPQHPKDAQGRWGNVPPPQSSGAKGLPHGRSRFPCPYASLPCSLSRPANTSRALVVVRIPPGPLSGGGRHERRCSVTTANVPGICCAPPVLSLGARPDGQYPQALLDDSAGGTVTAPAGGPPKRVLRDPAAILGCLGDHSRPGPRAAPRIVMVGAHPVTGELRGCPLTGAEMQSPDGGLLTMNPPATIAFGSGPHFAPERR